jgi:hypothetical protein
VTSASIADGEQPAKRESLAWVTRLATMALN